MRCSLDGDRRLVGISGAGNARGEARGLRPPVGAGLQDRTLRTAPWKHGLTLSLGDQLSPWREPRWDADRRAAPSHSLFRERGRVRVGAALRRQVQQLVTRLSAFCLLFSFSLGLQWRREQTKPRFFGGKTGLRFSQPAARIKNRGAGTRLHRHLSPLRGESIGVLRTPFLGQERRYETSAMRAKRGG